MTAELTDRARMALEDYLQRVREDLHGSDLDVAEVIDDIRDHVAAANSGGGAPVDADELAGVLRDLGPPDRWGRGDGETPSAAGAAGSTRTMAIVVFLATVAGLATFPWVGPLGLLAAWVLARTAVSHTLASGRALGPWKWLVLPPLVLFTGAVLLALIVAPIGPLAELPVDLPRWAVLSVGLTLWYGILAVLGRIFRRSVRWLLFPRLTLEDGGRR